MSNGARTSIVRSTALAAILALPSLAVFFALYYVFDEPVIGGIAGGVVHFVSLGFAFKAYKRLFGASRP